MSVLPIDDILWLSHLLCGTYLPTPPALSIENPEHEGRSGTRKLDEEAPRKPSRGGHVGRNSEETVPAEKTQEMR